MVVECGGTQAVSSSRDTRTPEGRNAINYVVFTDFTVSENGMEEHRERFLFSEPHQAHWQKYGKRIEPYGTQMCDM